MAEHARARALEPALNYCSSEPEPKVEMPVRSRWIPKPEQILMLESIFNGGMVNPTKDETVRIRKQLQKYGQVADANIFYWFQNRRSRSRRRQRLLQASRSPTEQPQAQPQGSGHTVQYADYISVGGLGPQSGPYGTLNMGSPSYLVGSSSLHGNDTCNNTSENEQNPIFCSATASGLNYQPGVITVFINGVPTEVGRGPVDMRAMFGGIFLMYDSYGMPVQVNEYGIVVQSLQDGESYFVVANP